MAECFLQVAKSTNYGILQICGFDNQHTSHTVVLRVILGQLVGVKLGQIRCQVEQPELSSQCLNVGSDDPGPIWRMPIHNQKDPAAAALDQPLEKADKNLSAHLAAFHHEPQVAPRADRRKHVEIEALPGDHRNQCLATRRQGRATVETGPLCALIFENTLGSSPFGQALDLWILLLKPLLDRRWVPLPAAKQWLLADQPQLCE